jgi:hypothetical protein
VKSVAEEEALESAEDEVDVGDGDEDSVLDAVVFPPSPVLSKMALPDFSGFVQI